VGRPPLPDRCCGLVLDADLRVRQGEHIINAVGG